MSVKTKDDAKQNRFRVRDRMLIEKYKNEPRKDKNGE